jgi:hypothetical protein
LPKDHRQRMPLLGTSTVGRSAQTLHTLNAIELGK